MSVTEFDIKQTKAIELTENLADDPSYIIPVTITTNLNEIKSFVSTIDGFYYHNTEGWVPMCGEEEMDISDTYDLVSSEEMYVIRDTIHEFCNKVFANLFKSAEKDFETTIESVFVVSTGHITKKDNDLLMRLGNDQLMEMYEADEKAESNTSLEIIPGIKKNLTTPCYIVDRFRYGFYVRVPDEEEESDEYSEAFQSLIKIARQKGCTSLKLDCGGEIFEDLETFNWEKPFENRS